jgi:hypothetical protein
MDGQLGTVEVSPTDQPAQFQVDINWYQTFSRNLTLEEVLVATAEDLIPNRVLDIDRTETLIMSRSGNDLLVEGIRFKDSDE